MSQLREAVREQREQLDMVLDELARRDTKEDKQVQVDACGHLEDAAVQTETLEKTLVACGTQTQAPERESDVLSLLQKLEKELQAVEQRNATLEKQLKQRAATEEEEENDERVRACAETLQRGLEAINLSCSCVENPFAIFAGDAGGSARKCVNLEHRLDAQAARLGHLQECSLQWRGAVVQLMKRYNVCDQHSSAVAPLISQPSVARCYGENTEVNCSMALRGVLRQLRELWNLCHGKRNGDDKLFTRELAAVLAQGKSGVKTAAKMVQEWAGWQASHLEEVRSLRQGAADERAAAITRRFVLLNRIDELEQRELDLQAELNALRKSTKGQDIRAPISSFPLNSCGTTLKERDTPEIPLKYPQLMLRLATAEQNLLAREEQMKAANATIRALTSCTPTATSTNISAVYDGNSMLSLATEIQRSLHQTPEWTRKQQKDLMNFGQYFQMEKKCLQLKTQLEAEQMRVATIQAVQQVCEQERDELLLKVEKLESEVLLASITREGAVSPSLPSIFSDPVDNDLQNYVFFLFRRLRLVENDNKSLLNRTRYLHAQIASLTKQLQSHDEMEKTDASKLGTTVFEMIVDHHQRCVDDFKVFLDTQRSIQTTTHINKYDIVDRSHGEWKLLLSHYEDLWIAFYSLYSGLEQGFVLAKSSNSSRNPNAFFNSVTLGSGCHGMVVPLSATDIQQCGPEALAFEISKQNEKILILQQKLLTQEEQLRGFSGVASNSDAETHSSCRQVESEHPPIKSHFNTKELPEVKPDETNTGGLNALIREDRPFLASMKPRRLPPPVSSMSSNGSGNEAPVEQTEGTEASSPEMKGKRVRCTLASTCYIKQI
ncbi:unnamed protein product [Phytophthora fragariaefolia]|uniref:Unnamed protein product n=1 Tax=Phytophthora fragariaefolia TaxID=1490495 RepID=A0A9W7CS66_9STRA|nr:unnamed protein product [Phytophthora fragariaefolia]